MRRVKLLTFLYQLFTNSYKRTKWNTNFSPTGGLIFISGGMDLALGLGWNLLTFVPTSKQFQCSWFIGFILGAIVAAPLISVLPKRAYTFISGFLVMASGIILTSAPFNTAAVTAARYINGIAIGFATISYKVYTSETSYKSDRGSCLAIEQYCLALGIGIQIICTSQWNFGIDIAENRLHGILSIIFALLALGATVNIIESPIFLLRKARDDEALDCQCRFEGQQVVTNEIKMQLEEHKNYVIQNTTCSNRESFLFGLGPLMKVLLYRSMVAFTFSLPLSFAIQISSLVSMGYVGSWPIIVFAVLRFLGALLSVCMIDCFGRKLVSLLALVAVVAATLTIGVIFGNGRNILNKHQMSIVCTFSLLLQLFAGVFAPSTSASLGEAFPLSVKPYFITLCIIVEQTIHIIVICTFKFTTYNMYVYLLSVGVIMSFFLLICSVTLPETKKTTLAEAQNRFKRFIHFRFC